MMESIKEFVAKNWKAYTAYLVLALSGWLVSLLTGNPFTPPLPPTPVFGHAMGWVDDQDAVQESLQAIEQVQGFKPVFGAQACMGAKDDNSPVFFWEAEQKVLGRVLPSWDQSSIGSCVSHGWGRAIQDLMLIQIVKTGAEEWPDAEICREAIYGGSRVQVGKGRLGRGDGSTGSWAAEWAVNGGNLVYKKYPTIDLSGGYQVPRCREWGYRGVPADLVPIAKEHPVGSVALVKTPAEAWAAIGNGYPIPVCSNVGFQSPLRDGFCARAGSWAHCMELRGRFTHPTKGRCFVVQNSWGNYLHAKPGDRNSQIDVAGRGLVQLPDGCFGITEKDAAAILAQGDSFAISSLRGFPAQKIDWFVNRVTTKKSDLAAIFNQRRNRCDSLLFASALLP